MVNETTLTDSLAVAERVRALMSRHGIGKRQQTTELCRILDLSFSQGHRKLRGSSPWTLAQIRKVADAFGEPAAQLIGTQSSEADVAGASAHEARLSIGALEWPCIAWIGGPLESRRSTEFVAYAQNDEWRVVRCEGVPEPGAREVVKIEIHPRRSEASRASIAVIDSDLSAAKGLADYLVQNGYTATIFGSLSTFREAALAQTFDAVITDWLFGDETAAAAIEAIRRPEGNPTPRRKSPWGIGGRSPHSDTPVILLTGELLTGKASESEISDVIRRFDVACYEKPARLAILTAELSKRLRRT
ncbi:MAG TPA: helix-turn-helix domain-containing protein [Trinickia sp.]|nr:helix-turn-helix domain-containing protein [Trinickia sp.]